MREWGEEIERRLSGSRLSPEAESDVVEELAQHLEDRYADLLASGVAADQAERAVLSELDAEGGTLAMQVAAARGGSRGAAEPIGSSGGAGAFGGLGGDVRYALRSLRRAPGYTAVVLVTLALGIGAVSAAQAVIHPLLLRPLAFQDPDRLVTLGRELEPGAGVTWSNWLMPGEYRIIREHATAFEQSSLVGPGRALGLSGDGEPERVLGASTTPDLFRTLGVAPVAGSLPDALGDDAGERLVLSHELWQRRFGGDPDVIGRSVRVDGRALPVVAVMPAGFSFPGRTQAWVSSPLDPANVGALWGSGGYIMVGRLAPEASAARAEAEVKALSSALSAANPFWTPPADYRADTRFISLHEALVGEVRRPLLLLGGAVALLLLIACANVGNLVLARGLGRVRELAVRTALGATARRIARQMVTETLVLASAGGLAGIALAVVTMRGARAVLPPDLPRLAEVGIDVRVLAASIAVTLATGLLLGVLPARRATRFDLQDSLRDGGRALGDRAGRRLSSGLVVAQVGLAVLLVTGAGLLARSLIALQRTDTGIARMDVVTARLDLPTAQYTHAAQRNTFFDELLSRLSAVPGVSSAAVTSQLPFSGHLQLSAMAVEHVTTDPNNLPMFVHRRVTPETFEALGVPLRRGRVFTPADAAPTALPVAIVDETAAREFWPGEDPVGKRLGRPWLNELLEVVGVVGSVLDGEMAGEAERTVYTPLAKEPPHSAFVVLNSAIGMRVVPGLRAAVREIDPTVPVSDVATVRSLVAGTLTAHRLSAGLLTAFGVLALVLAAVGIYGVLAYTVAQRGRELALRLALGAERGALVRMVLREGMRLALVGAALGTAAALALTRLLGGMLYGVGAQDPATLVGVVVVIVVAAAAAVVIPARRASRVDPMQVLRQ
jgi:putative ABC transport system permease protein